jgi:GNAT superfamily N-acetyltransferase
MIEHPSAEEFLAAREDLTAAYREAFTGPPWDESTDQVSSFTDGLAGWVDREGFAAAWVRDQGTVVGFAFRVRTPRPVPDSGFYAVLRDRFGNQVDTLAGAVEVVELAVRPSARGRGLGRDLLEAVVDGERAWLVTRIAATATIAFYDHLGWQEFAVVDGLALLHK